MRIIAGAWRGRALAAPKGDTTRPTSQRMRQALFDMLWHAPWAGRAAIEGVSVLDAFAGTGALGLEALSRGASHATFMEHDRAALAALRTNIAACGAAARVLAADATKPPRGTPCALVFLDPPYGHGLVPRAVAALTVQGWIAPNALISAEIAAAEPFEPPGETLARRIHGAACIVAWRHPVTALDLPI